MDHELMILKQSCIALATFFVLGAFAPEALAQTCSSAAQCDDSNDCTDDSCVSNNCQFTNNNDPCSDGLSCSINDVCGNGTCRGQDNCPSGQICSAQAGSCISPQISFGKSKLDLSGVPLNNPTTLQFGPDGKLYIGQQNGTLRIFTIARTGPNDYEIANAQSTTIVKNTPNHNDDDGALNAGETNRLLTGLLVTGTAENPVLYVTSSDPRIGGGDASVDRNVDSNSGVLHRVTSNGSGGFVKKDLVRGLPRSEENHSANGLALSDDGSTIYIAYGGHTNMGAPSNNFVFRPEYALSAAILSVDLAAIGNTTYDIPTLDDEDRANECSAGKTGSSCSTNSDCNTSGGAGNGVCSDIGDPFGGNEGKNQARLVPGGPVQVFAPGFRNPYDIVITESGRMYTVDNGPNAGWGAVPVGEGPAGNCTNAPNEPGTTRDDGLHLISGAGYYGGHPNPTRANMANKFNSTNPQSPVSANNAIECDFQQPGSAQNGSLHVFSHSTNGLDEYRASNFAGQLAGQLITASFNNTIFRIQLNGAGDVATLVTPLFSNVGGTQQDPGQPLDVTAQDDGEIYPGSIWVVDYGDDEILVFEPVDAGNCAGTYDALLDEDLDGYDNADEIDNGNNACSAADFPADNDSDFISNLNDPDDDNDGWLDHVDPFAIDAMNGKGLSVPFLYGWENDDPFVGGIERLGWTGLMTDGSNHWEALYDSTRMTSSGAAGVMTVDAASEGDALGALNSQEFGFQVGVNVPTSRVAPFTVHTRIVGPFLGTTPQDFQSMGLFIGNGDQDNYFKIVTAADNGGGSIETVLETGGTVVGGAFDTAPTFPGPDVVDLYLIVNPLANTVQGAYTTTSMTATTTLTPVGSPTAIPASWLDDPDFGVAVGVMSTSRGAAPTFAATWDFISVFDGTPGCVSNADCNDGTQCTADLCVDSACQNNPQPDGTTCDDGLTCTLEDECSAGVCMGIHDCPVGQICNALTDMCEISTVDSDNDGLFDAIDPCPADVRNFCFGPVAEDSFARELRINANVSSSVCSGTKTDCAGNTWLADFGFNNPASAYACNGCAISGLPTLFGCQNASTEDLLQCEHFDNPTGDPLSYAFNVPNGDYLVNLFFANTFDGTAGVGDRVFNVTAEGEPGLTNFDQMVAANGLTQTAVLRSILVTVDDGDGLTITFHHIAGKDNPAVKAIEIFAQTPPTTTTTTTLTTTTSTTSTTLPGCTQAADCSDGNPCTKDVCDTSSGNCSNPLEPFGASCTDGNPCTDDQCDGAGVCVSTNNTGACDDGRFCTATDTCSGGVCTGFGNPCGGGDVCDENSDACVSSACVDISAPASVVCYENRVCTIPLGLASNGLPVADVGATLSSALAFDCGPDCLEGAAATNGVCSLDIGTCSVQVADVEGSANAFSDGELARVDLVCTEAGSNQICLSQEFANDPAGAAHPTCAEDCVSFECGSCQSGDCNQVQSGENPVDAGDPVCIVNCLIGLSPAGADCACASDCNCVGGVEASDPVCAVLRVIGSFGPDTCAPGEITASFRVGDYAPDLRVEKGTPKLLRDGNRRSVPVSLKGTNADEVAGLRLALSAEGSIGRIRFVRRMRKAGWHLMIGRPGNGNVVVAITPPLIDGGVPGIDSGRVFRVRLKGGTTDVSIAGVQFGSKRGLPLTTIPVLKSP